MMMMMLVEPLEWVRVISRGGGGEGYHPPFAWLVFRSERQFEVRWSSSSFKQVV